MIELVTEGKMSATAGHNLARETLSKQLSQYELQDIIGYLDQVLRANMELWDEVEEIRAANSRKIPAARAREERKRGNNART